MKDSNIFPVTLAVKVAGITTLVLISYFLLMNFLGLATIVELRFFNFFIVLGGITWLMSSYKKDQGGKIGYLAGLGFGFATAFLTSLFFATFVYIYLGFMDPAFMTYLTQQRFGHILTPSHSAFVVLVEGTTSGAAISFGLMQYYRENIKLPELKIYRP